jgi:hypothetical protein
MPGCRWSAGAGGMGDAVGGGADDCVALLARARVEIVHPGVDRARLARVDTPGLHPHEHRLGQYPPRAVLGVRLELLAEHSEGLLENLERLAGEDCRAPA